MGSTVSATSAVATEGNGDLLRQDRARRQHGANWTTAGVGANSHGQAPGNAGVVAPRAVPTSGLSTGAGGATGEVGYGSSVGISGSAPGVQPSLPPAVSAQGSGVIAGGAGGGGHHGSGPVGPGPGMRKGGGKGPLVSNAMGVSSAVSGGGGGPGSSSKMKGLMGDGKGAVIRMRGLPYRASKSEVMGFFKGCSIPEEGIAFVTRADGRVTGEAYVRFATREDAKMGIRKDREMMVRVDDAVVLLSGPEVGVDVLHQAPPAFRSREGLARAKKRGHLGCTWGCPAQRGMLDPAMMCGCGCR